MNKFQFAVAQKFCKIEMKKTRTSLNLFFVGKQFLIVWLTRKKEFQLNSKSEEKSERNYANESDQGLEHSIKGV